MKKTEFLTILQVAILEFEGAADKLVPDERFKPELIKTGIKLCNYLKSINPSPKVVQEEK